MTVVSGRPELAQPVLALTFDDGPSPQTPAVLDVLGRHGARGTFFVTGVNAEGREDVLARTLAEGHEIGNHTYGHAHPADLDDDELRHDITRCSGLLAAAAPVLFRPPYGEDAVRCDRIASERGMATTVLWTVDPVDFLERSPEAIAEAVLHGAGPGAIVDFHDGWPPVTSTVPDRTPTVEALALILPELDRRGLRCVTVSELLAA